MDRSGINELVDLIVSGIVVLNFFFPDIFALYCIYSGILK